MKKITLVTGASSGLGRDLAKLLCKKGHLVYVTARRKDKLSELQKGCSHYNGKIKIISGDLSDSKFREKLIANILKEEGRIDYLVNNAGFGKVVSFEKQSIVEIQKTFDVNVIAYLHLTNLVLKNMLKRNSGRIINIGSVATFIPRAYYAIYNSTKSAIQTFNRSLRYELKDTNVNSSVVLCARIKTGFAKQAYDDYTEPEIKKYIHSFNEVAEDSEVVARKIIEKINSNKEVIIPNFRSHVAYLSRYFPDVVNFLLNNFLRPKEEKIITKKSTS